MVFMNEYEADHQERLKIFQRIVKFFQKKNPLKNSNEKLF